MTRLCFRVALCGFAIICFAAQATGQRNGDGLPPVDEGAKDPSFARYRSDLLRAAKARDLKRIMSMVSPSIKTHEASATGGLSILQRDWEVPDNSDEFFLALQQVLENGGRFQGRDAFIAPYWYLDFPGESSDLGIFRHILIPFRDVPSSGGAGPSQLSALEPPIIRSSNTFQGNQITSRSRSLEGRSGYIDKRFVVRPSGPYAYFRKEAGRWRLVVFATGLRT